MALLSMNQTTTFRWSFEDDVRNYAAADFPAIGVWRQKLSDCGVEKARELLEQSGLKVSSLFWAGGFTGSDGRSYRESVEDAIEAIRSADAIKAQTLIVCSGARGGHTHNHARRLLVSALKEMLPLAEELSITLAIEPMHPGCAADWTFLTSWDQALEVVEAVGSASVKLVFDTYHVGTTPDVERRIGQTIDRIGLVQLGDMRTPPAGEQDRCPLGEGIVPLPEIIAALKSAGYRGFYDVELLGSQIQPHDYPSALQRARQWFAERVEAAAEAGG